MFDLRTSRETPADTVVHTTGDGTLRIGVSPKGNDVQFMLRIGQDGESEFEVRARRYSGRVLEHVDITAQGELRHRPVGP
jgi:hypothetical protein